MTTMSKTSKNGTALEDARTIVDIIWLYDVILFLSGYPKVRTSEVCH